MRIVFAALFLALPLVSATKIEGTHLKNFYQVSPTLYRSEQPQNAKAYLQHNIQTVINLRLFHSDKEIFKDSNITLIEIPMRAINIDTEQVTHILDAYQKAKKPVAIHCKHGSDRTGLIVALYQILYLGYSKEQAIDELSIYGYHTIFRGVRTFIKNFDEEHESTRH